MIYRMSKKMYWRFRNGHENAAPMTHQELLAYLNRTLFLRGPITKIQTN